VPTYSNPNKCQFNVAKIHKIEKFTTIHIMFQNMVNKKWLQKVIEKTCKVTRVGWRRGKMGANCLKTVIERILSRNMLTS
jgi:hypothetical protein